MTPNADKRERFLTAEWRHLLMLNFPVEREVLEPGVRAECQRLLESTESLLARLNEQERICSEELQRRRDETRGELCQVVGGRAAAGAYRDAESPHAARWLDVAE